MSSRWRSDWHVGTHLFGNGFVCGNEGCFHDLELVSFHGAYLSVSELDFCFEFVTPPCKFHRIRFELHKGDV